MLAKTENFLKECGQRPWLIIAFILILGLLLRLLLLPVRWINPDEGAHMMGARYLLEGKIPIVDYGAREPLYLLVIAVFFKLFGISLQAGRLMPVLASTATGLMLYVLGKKLFDPKVGLVAASIFLFLPLMIFWAPIVKTEPLAAFFACLCIFYLASVLKESDVSASSMILAGLFAAAAFYVRQPTVSLPIIAIFFLLTISVTLRQRTNRIIWFLVGYLIPVIAVWSVYSNFMSLRDLFFSQLNPLNLILNRTLDLFGILPESLKVVETGDYRILGQDVAETVANLTQTVLLILPLVIGSIMALFSLQGKKALENRQVKPRWTLGLLYLWALVGVVIYGYQASVRGFFSQYGTEIYLPMILLTSYSFVTAIRKIAVTYVLQFSLASALMLIFIYLAQKKFWQFSFGIEFYVLLAGLLAGVCFYFFSMQSIKLKLALFWLLSAAVAAGIHLFLKLIRFNQATNALLAVACFLGITYFWFPRWLGRDPILKREPSLVATMFIAAMISLAVSGAKIGPSYDCIWSPASLKKISSLLSHENSHGEQVLSGAMIWQLQSGSASFLEVAHPTEFLKKHWQNFITLFNANPPAIIIDDGYTSRKFSKYWNFLWQKMMTEYIPIEKIAGSKFPVVIYKRKQLLYLSGAQENIPQ